jgi:hypothetical protein
MKMQEHLPYTVLGDHASRGNFPVEESEEDVSDFLTRFPGARPNGLLYLRLWQMYQP